MNKKLLGLSAAALLLAACSTSTGSANGTETKATVAGSDGSETTAIVTKKDGKITAIDVDVVSEDGTSKKEAGDDYGMKQYSGIGKEWYEQVEFLENYIIENGVDSVKLNAEGYAESEDVLAGCTMNIKDIMEAIDEANAE